MAKYVILINWTEQGARSVTETTQRAEHVTQMVEQMGGSYDHAPVDAGALRPRRHHRGPG
jgi:uncharacterized protein with GYD domain